MSHRVPTLPIGEAGAAGAAQQRREAMSQKDDLIASLEEQAKLGWRAASELLHPFGPVAANFSEAIRLLIYHYEKGLEIIPPPGQNHVIRLMRNNTVKATYYFMTKQYRPDVLAAQSPLTVEHLFAAYSAIDHAAIIAYCYLFRNLSKKIEKDEWDYVQTPLYEALAVGACAGINVPEIGFGFGLLGRGLRYLAFAAFLRENRRAFKEYRQHLKAKDLPFDIEFEERVWQCNNVQVSAIILERMGFNRSIAEQYLAAAERHGHTQPDKLYGVRFRLAEAVIDSYMEKGEVPQAAPGWVGAEVSLSTELRAKLMADLRAVMSEKQRIEWLNKGGSSISPETTPEFFAGMSEEEIASTQASSPADSGLPV